MKISALRRNWEEMGREDPFYYVFADAAKRGGGWDVDEFLATGRVEIAELMSRVDALGGCQHDAALDFGCGPGRLSQALADYFDSVTGVDIAESMVKLASELNQKGGHCRFLLNTNVDLSAISDRSFDLVYTSEVLQHMEPRYARTYIREFFRVTKPNGVVAFQIPDQVRFQALKAVLPEGLLSVLRRSRGRRGPVMQMYGLARTEIEALGRSTGASLEFVSPWNGSPAYPGWFYLWRVAGAAN